MASLNHHHDPDQLQRSGIKGAKGDLLLAISTTSSPSTKKTTLGAEARLWQLGDRQDTKGGLWRALVLTSHALDARCLQKKKHASVHTRSHARDSSSHAPAKAGMAGGLRRRRGVHDALGHRRTRASSRKRSTSTSGRLLVALGSQIHGPGRVVLDLGGPGTRQRRSRIEVLEGEEIDLLEGNRRATAAGEANARRGVLYGGTLRIG